MGKCKNFLKILYLIKKNADYKIVMQLKGVMAIKLGGGVKEEFNLKNFL